MKIAIVDDDASWRERIEQEILRYADNSKMQIDVYESGEQYVKSRKQYDISFIDIEMNGMDGFDTILKAKEYQQDGLFVILTTHVEMSRKGYLVNAFRYIDKTELHELEETIRSASVVLERNDKIDINVIGDGPRRLAFKNIIYVETEKHYIVVHTTQGNIKCKDKMQDIERALPGNSFSRCHNAYIVNLDKISHIDDCRAYLVNGDKIEISQRRIWQVRKAYFNRQYECANK